jgi:hypothetical protein
MTNESKCKGCGFYNSGHCICPFPCPKIERKIEEANKHAHMRIMRGDFDEKKE